MNQQTSRDLEGLYINTPHRYIFCTFLSRDWDGASLGRVKQRTGKHASWQSSSKPGSGKGTHSDSSSSVRHSSQKTGEGTVDNGQQLSETLQPENWGRHRWQWPASKRDSGIHLFLQETANHKISQSMLMAQSPKDSQWQQLASLLSMVQPPSRKTVQALVSTSS